MTSGTNTTFVSSTARRACRVSLFRQRGNAVLQVLIMLVVFSIIMIGKAKADAKAVITRSGSAIGQQMSSINQALVNFTSNSTNAAAIRTGGIITGVVNILSPTVAELKAVAGLDSAVSLTPVFNGGNFVTQVVLLPSGCAGTACSTARGSPPPAAPPAPPVETAPPPTTAGPRGGR